MNFNKVYGLLSVKKFELEKSSGIAEQAAGGENGPKLSSIKINIQGEEKMGSKRKCFV